MKLDARKQKVLEAIVIDYIATAEPVGSRTIARKYNLGVSPATIRNEMADLEEMGLIEQPHTSAGRIPSDTGYRYYVDCLMKRAIIAEEVQALIERAFQTKIKQLEDLIQIVGKVLSQITNCTALVLAPQIGKSTLQLIQLMLIEPGKALVVIVTDSGRIENKVLEIPENLTKEDLELVSKILNDKFKGISLNEWKQIMLRDLYSQLITQKKVLTLILELIDTILTVDNEDKVYLGGTLNILNQPEFKDVTKVRNLFELLEKEDVLRELLKDNSGDEVTVRIGTENKYEVMQDCSIITATYRLNGEVIGTIGVLGPTRMHYSKAVSIVEYLTQVLSLSIKKL